MDGQNSGINGKNLKLLRERVNWTRTQLADRAGITIGAVTRLESGDRNCRAGTLRALSSALRDELWRTSTSLKTVGDIMQTLTDP